MARRASPEKGLQGAVVALLRAHRVHVSVLGTVRRRPNWCPTCRRAFPVTCGFCLKVRPAHQGTQQTEGLPDLWLMWEDPEHKLPDLVPSAAWVELKAPTGALSAEQREWHRLAKVAGIQVQVWRSMEDALAWLIHEGLRRTP